MKLSYFKDSQTDILKRRYSFILLLSKKYYIEENSRRKHCRKMQLSQNFPEKYFLQNFKGRHVMKWAHNVTLWHLVKPFHYDSANSVFILSSERENKQSYMVTGF